MFARSDCGEGLRGWDVATGERVDGGEAHRLTTPLAITADGQSMPAPRLSVGRDVGHPRRPDGSGRFGRGHTSLAPRSAPTARAVLIGTSEAAEVYPVEPLPTPAASDR